MTSSSPQQRQRQQQRRSSTGAVILAAVAIAAATSSCSEGVVHAHYLLRGPQAHQRQNGPLNEIVPIIESSPHPDDDQQDHHRRRRRQLQSDHDEERELAQPRRPSRATTAKRDKATRAKQIKLENAARKEKNQILKEKMKQKKEDKLELQSSKSDKLNKQEQKELLLKDETKKDNGKGKDNDKGKGKGKDDQGKKEELSSAAVNLKPSKKDKEDDKLTKQEKKEQLQLQQSSANAAIDVSKPGKKDDDKGDKGNKDKDKDKDKDKEDDIDKLTKQEKKEQLQLQQQQQQAAVAANKENLTKKEKKEQMKMEQQQAKHDKLEEQQQQLQQQQLQQMEQIQLGLPPMDITVQEKDKLTKQEKKDLLAKLQDGKPNFENVGRPSKNPPEPPPKEDNNDVAVVAVAAASGGGMSGGFVSQGLTLQQVQTQLDSNNYPPKLPVADKVEVEDNTTKPPKVEQAVVVEPAKVEQAVKPQDSALAFVTGNDEPQVQDKPQAQAMEVAPDYTNDTVEDDEQPKPNNSNNNSNNNYYKPFFLESLPDNSIPLDSFEHSSTLDWHLGYSTTAWSYVDNAVTKAHDGQTSLMSGLSTRGTNVKQLEGLSGRGKKVHSDLTLTTDKEFEGGVVSFHVKIRNLVLPNDAFYVLVDEELALSPPTSTTTTSTGSSGDEEEWVEYSVAVASGKHVITWSHVYNPFGLDVLPPRGGDDNDNPTFFMDNVRFNPFSNESVQGFEGDEGKSFLGSSDQVELQMATTGDATWQVDQEKTNAAIGSYSIFASSDDISSSSGNANVEFVLNSQYGGTLKYKLRSSTTAPLDDFCILLNGIKSEAVFGQSANYESRRLDIPPGKVAVTLQHRKNPGELSRVLLDTLGVGGGNGGGTEGKTWLDDVRFEPSTSGK